MSAPTASTRVPPSIPAMTNGFPIMLIFAEKPDVAFWNISITPPGVHGGDSIDTTTQENETWRTKAARILKELTNSKATANWHPEAYTDMKALCNKETSITILFPTSPQHGIVFWGYLKDGDPQEIEESSTDPPRIELEIVATMCDPNDPLRKEEDLVVF